MVCSGLGYSIVVPGDGGELQPGVLKHSIAAASLLCHHAPGSSKVASGD